MGQRISGKLGLFGRTIELHGEIVSYHFIFEVREEGPALEDLQSRISQVEGEIQELVQLYLRRDIKVQEVRVQRGSIEVIVVLGTVYGIYLGISKYKNFIESLQLLQSQIQRILRRIIEMYGVRSAQGNTILSSTLPGVDMSSDSDRTLTMTLFFYLLLSHAALLGFFIWLVVKKFSV